MKLFFVMLAGLFLAAAPVQAAADQWKSGSPRKEIEPDFSSSSKGGRSGKGSLVIENDRREGLYGYWFKEFPVTGGKYYRFCAYRRTSGVEFPRRSSYARLLWDNGALELTNRPSGRGVKQDAPLVELYFPNGPQPGEQFITEPEFPQDGPEVKGWTAVSGVYRAPAEATRVVVELNLQWAPGGKVEWSDVTLEECAPPPERKVRLAAVNFGPGKNSVPLENCQNAVPFVEEAARQKADLVVFSEQYPTHSLLPGYNRQDSAESIPGGEICNFFCALAKKHNLYIVLSMYEREGSRIFNTAVLFGPEGVVGKYRKATITFGEIAKGVTPGNEYPVFETRFGKVGLMVCYDAQYPEVASQLARRGAEIIALPANGYTTSLGIARAVENQVYVVASVYVDDGKSPANDRWGISGVISPEGKIIARAPAEGTVAVVEVDLNKPWNWPWLGNWKETIPRLRPVIPGEAPCR
jgi:predicted amidohydrolase